MIVKLRYKTDAKPEDTLQWRVLIDGVEYHASFVSIDTQAITTKDRISEGVDKWHITCQATSIKWVDEKCFIS
jgi:hypothetical protein